VTFYTSPFFWSLIAMFGLHGATSVVSGHRIGRNLSFVSLVLMLVTVGRVVLVLPFCVQPRLELGQWRWAVGGIILALALGIAAPALSVKWWRPPAPGMRLHTSGIYSIIRHPIYLSEVLWPIGWSLMWNSSYGLALTPLWWIAFTLHALVEEEQLERVLGSEYAEYKKEVRARIFPGVPM